MDMPRIIREYKGYYGAAYVADDGFLFWIVFKGKIKGKSKNFSPCDDACFRLVHSNQTKVPVGSPLLGRRVN